MKNLWGGIPDSVKGRIHLIFAVLAWIRFSLGCRPSLSGNRRPSGELFSSLTHTELGNPDAESAGFSHSSTSALERNRRLGNAHEFQLIKNPPTLIIVDQLTSKNFIQINYWLFIIIQIVLLLSLFYIKKKKTNNNSCNKFMRKITENWHKSQYNE